MSSMKLAVAGLGKLGLPIATLFASRDNEVLGIDQNEWLVSQVQRGQCPIKEPDLPELLASVNGTFQASLNYEQVTTSDIIFIIVPTPSNKEGLFINDYILSSIKSIGKEIKHSLIPPLIVVCSTVMPGTMEKVIKPELQKITGKDIDLCYNPEFVALGSVIHGMDKPDSILIGESSKEAGDKLVEFYEKLHRGNPPPICRMNLWNAEVAKLALNVAVTTKVSIANTIAEICEKIPEGNADDITNFLGLDSRIGSKYLKGGLSYGGPCFPRDNRAFNRFATDVGVTTPIQSATDEFNRKHSKVIANRIERILFKHKGNTVSFLGLTYKPDTPVVEESPAIAIIKELPQRLVIKVYDPQGLDFTREELGNHVIYCGSIMDCITSSDLCVVATQWKEFKNIVNFNSMRTKVVLDCWRMLDKNKVNAKYYALGVND